MGTDKATLVVGGHPLVARSVEALHRAGSTHVVLIGGEGAVLETYGYTWRADRWPGEGPLGGIITALGDGDPDEIVVVLSCDLVSPEPTAIRRLVAALGDADVAVPELGGQAQWMHAAWRAGTRPHLEAAFDAGERAPRSAVADLRIAWVGGMNPDTLRDADSPTDLPNDDGSPRVRG
jgi:molybdopterin-guanine dinucleotide biosynthesis protein A